MAHDVFVSYSSKDKPAADAACAVLESSGIRCWIAPRDILPGTDWGESIIGAINGCKLMVLIFSSQANDSHQIKREVERVVNRGLPIIPVRIEEVLPAQALEYFLSTPHWMDAFTPPLERHLERLTVIVHEILNQTPGERKTVAPLSRPSRLRTIKPLGTAAAVITALILLAIIALHNLGSGSATANNAAAGPPKPNILAVSSPNVESKTTQPASLTPKGTGATVAAPSPAPPASAATPHSPLAGRWQSELKGDNGKKFDCLMDLQDQGVGLPGALATLSAAFSDFCPLPFCGYRGIMQISQDGTWAPTVFRAGKDTGTFLFQGGSLHGATGAYRIEGDNTLIMTSAQLPAVEWKRIKAEGPLPTARDKVLPEKLEWPTKDMPSMVQRAQEYVRTYWQKDAMLVDLDVKHPQPLSSFAPVQVDIVFEFYSPETKHGLRFEPGAQYGNSMTDCGVADWGTHAVPAQFLDLPDAIASLSARGISAKLVSEASLEYDETYDYRNVRANNAILPPSPYRETGFHWRIDSDGNDRVWVFAEKP